MKKITFLLLFFSFNKVAVSQKYMDKRNLQIGTSLTYMPDGNRNVHGQLETQWNWSFNIATSITKQIQIGIENMVIYHTDFNNTTPLQSNLLGGFVQYSIFSDEKVNVYGEFGLYKGNYCSCLPLMPYQKPGLNYHSVGAGFNYKLGNGFYLDIAFYNYQIFNKIKGKYNNTKYVLGVNYVLNLGFSRKNSSLNN